MDETENTGEMLEAAAPDVEDMGEAQAEPEQTEEIQEERKETTQELNFKRLRESNEQLQRENEQNRQMMLALQQELLNRSSTTEKKPEPEPDPFEGIDKSDWATYEAVEKLAAKIAAEQTQKALKEERERIRKEQAPQRIKSRFEDFEAVVTKENVEQLREIEPDIAEALSMIGDEEKKAVAAYKYIKAFVPNMAEAEASKKRIQENANQPKSLSSAVGKSPLTKASAFEQGLTPDLKKQLYAEMMACARKA